VKILDFGIAKLTRPEDRGGVKTDTQAVMGTPLYMSPEQCAGAGGVDAKSDVYSLGCVLYEVLAGRTPFVAEGAGRLIGMHLYQQPPPLTSHAAKLPAGVAELVHRMLTKDKLQRPSMNDIADDMGRLLAKLSGAGPVVRSRLPTATDPNATRSIAMPEAASTLGQSIGQSSRRRRRSRLVAAGLAGAGLLALIVALFYRQNSQPISTAPRPDLSVAPTSADKAAAARVAPPPPTPSPDSKPKSTAGGTTSGKPGPAARDGATNKPTPPSNKPTTSKPATSKPATSKPTPPTTNPPKRIGYED
jgi:serine/threonine protein kinase